MSNTNDATTLMPCDGCGVVSASWVRKIGGCHLCYGCWFERESKAYCDSCGRPLAADEDCDCVKLRRMGS